MKVYVNTTWRQKDENGEIRDVPVSTTVDAPIGESLDEAMSLHGEEEVFNAYQMAACLLYEAEGERVLKGGRLGSGRLSPEEATRHLEAFRLGDDPKVEEKADRIAQSLLDLPADIREKVTAKLLAEAEAEEE